MGTSKSFAEFEKKIRKSADDLKSKSDEKILLASAKKAKATIAPQVARAVPSGRMNVGKSGTRVSVFYRKEKAGAYLVAVRGPLHLVERDTKAHSIPRVKGDLRTHTTRGKKRAKASKVRKVVEGKKLSGGPGSGFFAVGPVKHPGTKGKHPWEKGKKAFLPSAGKTFEAGVDSIMRGVFG